MVTLMECQLRYGSPFAVARQWPPLAANIKTAYDFSLIKLFCGIFKRIFQYRKTFLWISFKAALRSWPGCAVVPADRRFYQSSTSSPATISCCPLCPFIARHAYHRRSVWLNIRNPHTDTFNSGRGNSGTAPQFKSSPAAIFRSRPTLTGSRIPSGTWSPDAPRSSVPDSARA